MATPERDPLKALEEHARATEDLSPEKEFVDAIIDKLAVASADEVLAHAKHETVDLAPADEFVSSVMQAVQLAGGAKNDVVPPWQTSTARFARIALLGSAAVAVLSLWFSFSEQSSFDAVILDEVASVEVYE